MEGVSFTDAQTSTPTPAPIPLAPPRQLSTPTPTRQLSKTGSVSNKKTATPSNKNRKTASSSNKKAVTPANKHPRIPLKSSIHRTPQTPVFTTANDHVRHAVPTQTLTEQGRPVKALPARSKMAFVTKGSLPVRFVDDEDKTLQETSWDSEIHSPLSLFAR